MFTFERQWKEDHPYFKVTSSNHSYFNDMGMPKLLKSVEKVDDYTVKITLNQPEAPFLSEPRDGVRRRPVEGICRRDAQGRHAREDRPGADRHRAVLPRAVPEGRGHPLQGLPGVLGRQGQDRRPRLLDHAGRVGALGQAAEGRMPRDALSEPGRPRRDPQGCRTSRCSSSRASTSAISPTTRTKKPFDDVRVRKAINMAINKKAIIDAVYLSTGVAAKNPIPPSMWSYNDAIKDDPYDPEAAKKLLAEAGYPERLRDRPVGDAGAAALQPERQAHRRTDAGRPRQDRRQGRDQDASNGASTASACRPASTRWACSAGPATTAIRTTSCTRCSAATRRKANGCEHRQVLPPAVRRPGPEGEDDRPTRRSAPSSTSRRR